MSIIIDSFDNCKSTDVYSLEHIIIKSKQVGKLKIIKRFDTVDFIVYIQYFVYKIFNFKW